MIDIENNYKTYIDLIKSLESYGEDSANIDKFIRWADGSDLKVAPASTKYHLSSPGGLVQHMLNVYNRLVKLVEFEYGSVESSPYTLPSIIKVALLHDISKVNIYVKSFRNVQSDDGSWHKVLYYNMIQDNDSSKFIYGDHTENSVFMANKFFKMSYEEELSILHHMGGLDYINNDTKSKNSVSAYKVSTLALLLHLADMMAMCIDEVEVNNK